MADPVFEDYAAQMGPVGGDLPLGAPAPMPTQAAPGGTTLGEMSGAETGLGRYQKYLDALEQRLGRYYEQPQEPTLAQRLGMFAMAMGNPEMARDVLRQRAAEDLDRRRRNLELSHSIIQNALRLGDLEADQENADRNFQLDLLRASAYATQVARSGERRAAGRALGGIGAQARQLAAEAARLDPNAKAREQFYLWALKQVRRDPITGEITFMDPTEARAMADARYPRSGAGAGVGSEMTGIGMTPAPPDVSDTLGGLEGPPGSEGEPIAPEDFLDEGF